MFGQLLFFTFFSAFPNPIQWGRVFSSAISFKYTHKTTSKLYQYRILLDQFIGTMNITIEKKTQLHCFQLIPSSCILFDVQYKSKCLAENCNEAKPKANNQKAHLQRFEPQIIRFLVRVTFFSSRTLCFFIDIAFGRLYVAVDKHASTISRQPTAAYHHKLSTISAIKCKRVSWWYLNALLVCCKHFLFDAKNGFQCVRGLCKTNDAMHIHLIKWNVDPF